MDLSLEEGKSPICKIIDGDVIFHGKPWVVWLGPQINIKQHDYIKHRSEIIDFNFNYIWQAIWIQTYKMRLYP